MENVIIAANAVVPFVAYLALGYLSRWLKITDTAFLNRLNKVCFRLFFPFVTFYNIYKIDVSQLSQPLFIGYLLFIILATTGLGMMIVPRLVKDIPKIGVIIQASFRSNFIFFGIPIAVSVCGPNAAGPAAIAATVLVSTYNVISVIVLEYYNGDAKSSPKTMLKDIITNPLLDGAIVGIIFCVFGIKLPVSISTPCEAIANMVTPLAVFILGGSFVIGNLKKNLKYIVPTLVIKLLIVPIIFVSLGYFLGLRNEYLFSAFIASAAPVATASYVMAQNMGGDGELAGQLVVTSTIISIFTLFLWIFLFKQIGLV